MFRRRRPVLGAAIVGGAAYRAGKNAQAAQQVAEPEEAELDAAEEPAGGLTNEAIAQLEKLGQLHEAGILTEEEFAEQKQRLLQG